MGKESNYFLKMFYPHSRTIINYYDISVIIIVKNDFVDLKKNLEINHRYFTGNGIEVILVLSETNNEILNIPEMYPFINWKIVSYRCYGPLSSDSQWNHGLKIASNKYALCFDSSIVLPPDIIYRLRYILYHYTTSFAVVSYSKVNEKRKLNNVIIIMAETKNFLAIGGYTNKDEESNFLFLRYKLKLICKLTEVQINQAINSGRSINKNKDSNFFYSREFYKHILNYKQDNIQQGRLIKSRSYFNWKIDRPFCLKELVLNKFLEYEFHPTNNLKKQFDVICLIQIRNEKQYLPSLLLHLEKFCDGIILLDDGSSDSSFEKAQSDKLLLKAKKQYSVSFNDLENRNLLLDLAYLFKSKWFFFMDADERFDLRYANIHSLIKQEKFDVIGFKMVNLWDKETQYRVDMPEGKKGVMVRYRMFKNMGYMQIKSKREIHFRATPFKLNRTIANVLVLHYGLMSSKTRKLKYQRYLVQDQNGLKQSYNYGYLQDRNITLADLSDLIL